MSRRMKSRIEQMQSWLGPMRRYMAMAMRFEDGGGSDAPPAGDTPGDTPGDQLAGNMLSDPPVGTKPATPPAAPSILVKPSGILKDDGSFIDDWVNSDSLPEEVRGSESLKVIKNFNDLVKRTVNAEKMVGKKGVVLPTEKSSESEWASFYEAIGRPKAPDGYSVEIPEDMKSLFTDERLEAAKQRAFKMGVTASQFQQFVAGEIEDASRILEEQTKEDERLRDEAELGLKREWGEAYDERIHVVKRLIAETFGKNETQRLDFLQKYGNDPSFIRFAANVGSRLVEHKALVAELTNETPSQALAKIKELEATPGYLNIGSDMTPEQRQHITAQIREQYKIAYPDRK